MDSCSTRPFPCFRFRYVFFVVFGGINMIHIHSGNGDINGICLNKSTRFVLSIFDSHNLHHGQHHWNPLPQWRYWIDANQQTTHQHHHQRQSFHMDQMNQMTQCHDVARALDQHNRDGPWIIKKKVCINFQKIKTETPSMNDTGK